MNIYWVIVNAVMMTLIAVVGVLCVARPAQVQQFILRQRADNLAWKLNPFVPLMEMPEYRVFIRFAGIMLLLFDAVGIFFFLWPR